MIGTDLNLTLPSTADTYSTAITKVATALQAIEDSIADAATPAGLDITANLSIGGNHLTNVGGVVLAAGNSPSTAGSLYYSGGNFYLKDATGVIQVTSGGALSITSAEGITGDYGSGPEELTYDNASGEYRFKEESTLYADARMDDLILMEPGASPTDSVRVTAQAMSASYTMTLPAAVPAGDAFLMMDSSGTVTADQGPTLAADQNITLQGTGEVKHGDRVMVLSAAAFVSNGSTSYSYGPNVSITSTGAATLFASIPLRTGDRVKHVVFAVFGNASADLTAISVVITTSSGTSSVIGTETVTNAAAAWVDIPVTTTDTVLAAGEAVTLYMVASASGISVGNIRVTYDRP